MQSILKTAILFTALLPTGRSQQLPHNSRNLSTKNNLPVPSQSPLFTISGKEDSALRSLEYLKGLGVLIPPDYSINKGFLLHVLEKTGSTDILRAIAADQVFDNKDFIHDCMEIVPDCIALASSNLLTDPDLLSKRNIYEIHNFITKNPEKIQEDQRLIFDYIRGFRIRFIHSDFNLDTFLDEKKTARFINSHAELFTSNNNVISRSFLQTILVTIPKEELTENFKSYILKHTPFVFRDDVLQDPNFNLDKLLPFDLSFIQTDPPLFLEPFSEELQQKHIPVISHHSLYTIAQSDKPDALHTQDTVYNTKTPTVLIIPSNEVHSGLNDLLQSRKLYGKPISKFIKIVIVGSLDDLTPDVANRVQAEYMDEYSIRHEQLPSLPNKTEPALELEKRYKTLPRLSSDQLLKMPFQTIEEHLIDAASSSPTVLQNSDELALITPDNSVYRYVPTRVNLNFVKPPFFADIILVYHYATSFDRHIEQQLLNYHIPLDDTRKIARFLKNKIVLIPPTPKLDTLSKFQMKDQSWWMTFNHHDYRISDLKTHDLKLLSAPETFHWPPIINRIPFSEYYFDSPDLFMENSIAKKIFEETDQFLTSARQWLIFEGVPALGKDAYLKRFIASLKHINYPFQPVEITASNDQPLLDQIMHAYNQYTQPILFQISEINLASPAQLYEISHFCSSKPIKIIGTQNSQSQIRTRFTLNDSIFPFVKLQGPDGHFFIQRLIDWITQRSLTPLNKLVGHIQDLYSVHKDNPTKPTPRQLIFLTAQFQKIVEHEGIERAYQAFPKLFNSVFFRYSKTLYLQEIEPDPNLVIIFESSPSSSFVSLSSLQTALQTLSEPSYDLTPGIGSNPNLWEGPKSMFLEYVPEPPLSFSQINLDSTQNSIRTQSKPNEPIVLPIMIGSTSGVVTLYDKDGQLLKLSMTDLETLYDRHTNTFQNIFTEPIEVRITFENPLPLFSDLKKTNVFSGITDMPFDVPLETHLLRESEIAILNDFITKKTGSRDFTKLSLMAALDITKQKQYSVNDILDGIYTYFSQFTEDHIPYHQESDRPLYDSLVFQKGVCRHQAELGRIVFLSMGIYADKKVMINHLGQPLHDYLISTVFGDYFIVNFVYTPFEQITDQKNTPPIPHQPGDIPVLKQNPNSLPPPHEIYENYYVFAALLLVIASGLAQRFRPEHAYISAALLLLLVSGGARHMSSSLNHMYSNVSSTLEAMPHINSKFMDGIDSYQLSSIKTQTELPPLPTLLQANPADWKTHKEALILDLIDKIPTEGVTFQTRFAPADTPLDTFGTPVYDNGKLLFYKIQKEVKSQVEFSTILLHPHDKASDVNDAEVLLLTKNGWLTLDDFHRSEDSEVFIENAGKMRIRSLSLVYELSHSLDIPFAYANELETLKEEQKSKKRGNLRGAHPAEF